MSNAAVILLVVCVSAGAFFAGYQYALRKTAQFLEILLNQPLSKNYAYNTGRLDVIRDMISRLGGFR